MSFWEGEDAAEGEEVCEEGLGGMALQQNALARQPGEICTMVGGSGTSPATAGFAVSYIAGIWHSLVAPCWRLRWCPWPRVSHATLETWKAPASA